MPASDALQIAFLHDALAFHLAVMAAALALIYLGYRLFDHVKPGEDTSLDASLFGASIKIQKTTSGVIFAALGCVLLIFVVMQGEPSFNRTVTHDGTKTTNELVLRGDQAANAASPFQQAVESALKAEQAGDDDGALARYADAFRPVAAPLNNMAFIYCRKGQTETAASLIKLARGLDAQDPHYQDTESAIAQHRCGKTN